MSQSQLHFSSYTSPEESCNHLKVQNKYIQRDNVSFRVNQLEENQIITRNKDFQDIKESTLSVAGDRGAKTETYQHSDAGLVVNYA